MQLITICSYIIQEGNGINTEDSRRKGSSKVTPTNIFRKDGCKKEEVVVLEW